MTWSLKLFTVRGIAVRLHASFLLILAWAAYTGTQAARDGGLGSGSDWIQGAGFMVLFVILLFGCVLLHELGHALVAQLFGVQVRDITLWPLGGLARMNKMPRRAHQEFLISAAGPATNVLVAALLALLLLAWQGPEPLLDAALSGTLLGTVTGQMSVLGLLLLLIANNILLVLFNLLPALPMDGGRLLRSLLAAFMSFTRATQLASVIGQALAVLMVGVGLLTGNMLLGLVAVFVFVAAGQERRVVAVQADLAGARIRDAMQPVGRALHPLERLGEIALELAVLPQSAYLVVDGGRLLGLLPRGQFLAALGRTGPEVRVGQCITHEFLQLGPDEALADGQDRLLQSSSGMAVVVEAGRVIGTVSLRDVARMGELLRAYPQILGSGRGVGTPAEVDPSQRRS